MLAGLLLLVLQAAAPPPAAPPPPGADCKTLYTYIAETVVVPHDTLGLHAQVEQTRPCTTFNAAQEAYLAQIDFHLLYLKGRYADVLAFEETHPFWASLTADERRYANVKHLIGNAYTMRGEVASSLWNYLAAAPWHENGGKLWSAFTRSYTLLYGTRMAALQVLLVTFLTIYFFRSGGDGAPQRAPFLRLQATREAEVYTDRGERMGNPSLWLAAALRDRVTVRTRTGRTFEGQASYRDETSIAVVVDHEDGRGEATDHGPHHA